MPGLSLRLLRTGLPTDVHITLRSCVMQSSTGITLGNVVIAVNFWVICQCGTEELLPQLPFDPAAHYQAIDQQGFSLQSSATEREELQWAGADKKKTAAFWMYLSSSTSFSVSFLR